jgi:hypothetical protein
MTREWMHKRLLAWPYAWPRQWVRSLQWRVLLGMLIGLTLALVLAGFLLSGLFKDHATRQFQAELATHLEQLTARLAFDATGQPLMDPSRAERPPLAQTFLGAVLANRHPRHRPSRAPTPARRAPLTFTVGPGAAIAR